MRFELENVKEIMQRAADKARSYHESIAHVQKTCRPEAVVSESKVFIDSLNESVQKAKAEAFAQLDSLSDTIKKRSLLDIQNYRPDIVEFFKTMKPGAEDLESIAKQFDGNETMLQFFHRYREENGMIAELPMRFADKQKRVQSIREDLGYAFNYAAAPFDKEKNRTAHTMLQHWGDNFEIVFSEQIGAIGDF